MQQHQLQSDPVRFSCLKNMPGRSGAVMGYSVLRSPRRRFGTRYSAFTMLAQVRAEAEAKRDLFADARRRRVEAVGRVLGRAHP